MSISVCTQYIFVMLSSVLLFDEKVRLFCLAWPAATTKCALKFYKFFERFEEVTDKEFILGGLVMHHKISSFLLLGVVSAALTFTSSQAFAAKPKPVRIVHPLPVPTEITNTGENPVPVVVQGASIEDTVSFLANVDPNSFETTFTAVRGTQQISTATLNSLIRSSGGYVFRIRSIHAHLLTGVPNVGDYAVFFLGACDDDNSTRGFGAGSLAVGGNANEQVTFLPGVVASLGSSESLCLRSLIQSNHTVRVEVHGVLVVVE